MNTEKIAKEGLIFETLTGSLAYGMNTPESDVDYRGIFVAPKENVVTGMFPIDQWQDPDADLVYYELRKYIKLLSDMNPNILELVWVDEKFITHDSPTYRILRGMRDELLSSKAKHTFSGYAYSQLQRIRGHYKWIENPQPEEKPRQSDYVNLFEDFNLNVKVNIKGGYFQRLHGHVHTLSFDGDKYKKMYTDSGEIIIQDGRQSNLNDAVVVTFDRDRYEHDLNQWKGYWEWRNNRNEKRLKLEDNYGYDTKHAAHLIRLLRMGKEILRDGVVNVWRNDAADLLDIRNGKYTYDEIIEMSDELDNEIETLYTTTELPKTVDRKKVSKLILNMYEEYWNGK